MVKYIQLSLTIVCKIMIIFVAKYLTETDSLGIVFWELVVRTITGVWERPYAEYPNLHMDFMIIVQSSQGLRPTIPEKCPESLKTVIKTMMDGQPENRPELL